MAKKPKLVLKLDYTYVFCLCLFVTIISDGSMARTVYSDEMEHRCVSMPEGFLCSDVPYNMTTFPNSFGHQNLDDAQSALNNFVPLIATSCSKYLKQFLCFVFAPPCTVLDTPLKVCRSLCEEAVTKECRDILEKYKQDPEVLRCDNYPNVGLCIGQNNTISDFGGSDVTMPTELFPSGEKYFTDDMAIGSQEVHDDIDLHLLVTNGNKIQLLQIRSPNTVDTITVFRGLVEVTTVEYYKPDDYLYWSLKHERKIFRGKLVLESLEDVRSIVSVDSSVASIAVDHNLKVLFWLESYPKARLRTSSLSGRGVTTLSSRDFFQPISLTLDSTEGLLFWINKRGHILDQFSTIESYSVVTEKRTAIFNISDNQSQDGGRPQAMVADVQEKRLYWIDAMSKSLHSIDYKGRDHHVILRDHKRLSDPESIEVRDEHVLWTDRKTNSIVWVNKRTGRDELIVKTFDSSPPQNIQIFGRSEYVSNRTTYDKSSLSQKWHDLSSKENMELDDDDDAYYAYYDYENDNRKRRPKQREPPESSANRQIIDIATLIFSSLTIMFVRVSIR